MLETIRVRDWMTGPVYTVLPTTPIATAAKIMKDKHVRRLPVMTAGTLKGIVTLGDVREAQPSDATTLSIWELNFLWAQLTVERVMTPAVITIGPDNTMIEAAELMLKHKISGLPVVENGDLVGIVTESDIFRMLVKTQSSTETTGS